MSRQVFDGSWLTGKSHRVGTLNTDPQSGHIRAASLAETRAKAIKRLKNVRSDIMVFGREAFRQRRRLGWVKSKRSKIDPPVIFFYYTSSLVLSSGSANKKANKLDGTIDGSDVPVNSRGNRANNQIGIIDWNCNPASWLSAQAAFLLTIPGQETMPLGIIGSWSPRCVAFKSSSFSTIPQARKLSAAAAENSDMNDSIDCNARGVVREECDVKTLLIPFHVPSYNCPRVEIHSIRNIVFAELDAWLHRFSPVESIVLVDSSFDFKLLLADDRPQGVLY
eukprot:scaffold1559_cov114-Cylindrotheca_fusiformis.AAC.10